MSCSKKFQEQLDQVSCHLPRTASEYRHSPDFVAAEIRMNDRVAEQPARACIVLDDFAHRGNLTVLEDILPGLARCRDR